MIKSKMRFPRRNKIAKNCDFYINNENGLKPSGYWYSFGKEWYDFWYVDGKNKIGNNVVCEIKIKRNMFTTLEKKEKGKILIIDSIEEVQKLKKKYSYLIKFGDKTKPRRLINFEKLSEIYGGIEFRNFNKINKQIDQDKKHNRYQDYLWYKIIDVSSGCVWNSSLVETTNKGKLKDFI